MVVFERGCGPGPAPDAKKKGAQKGVQFSTLHTRSTTALGANMTSSLGMALGFLQQVCRLPLSPHTTVQLAK